MIDRRQIMDAPGTRPKRWLRICSVCMLMLSALSLAMGCAAHQHERSDALQESDAATGHVATAGMMHRWPLPENDLEGIAVDEPTMSDPVEIGIALLAAGDGSAADGAAVLAVRVRIAPTWHIYPLAGTEEPGMMLPTDIAVELPDGWSLVGDWWAPQPGPVMGSDGLGYTNDVVFQRRVRRPVTAAATTDEIRCRVQYQACDPMRCMPPIEKVATIAVSHP